MEFGVAGGRRSGYYSVCIVSISNDQPNLLRDAKTLAES